MNADRRARLVALGEAHRDWVEGKLNGAPFDPAGRPDGSDYNQHYVDLEADDDAFHARAREVMGITA